MSNIVDRKTENYKKLFFCKVPPKYKKKEQFKKNGAFLFSFSIYTAKKSVERNLSAFYRSYNLAYW